MIAARRHAKRRAPAVKPAPACQILLGGAAAFILAGLAAAAFSGPKQPPSGSVAGAPRMVLAVALDTTDPLIGLQPRQVEAAVNADLAGLRPADRVVVLELSGQAAVEARPVVDAFLPSAETNVDRNRLRDRITAPISALLKAVAARPEAEASPIIETVVNLASDRTLNIPGSHLRVLLVSDALQHSTFASAYPPRIAFPAPSARPLRGVTVELAILKNPRDIALQPGGVTSLVNWLEAAGAEVIYAPPPWMALAGPQPGSQKPAAQARTAARDRRINSQHLEA